MIIQNTNFGSIQIIRSGVHEGKYCFGDHIHQFSELVWVLDGELEMTVNGKMEIAKKGDFTVISPFAIHSFFTPEYSKIHIAVISDSFIVGRITLPAENKVIVEGVNVATCHTKPRRQGETGGIVKKETPIRTCKVALYCEKCGKGVRVGHNVVDGKKVRVCRKCGAEI